MPLYLTLERLQTLSWSQIAWLYMCHRKCLVVSKGLSSQGYGFSSGHVWMWELDCEESWVPKNWCFWTVVLEKTHESPLDCKEIQPVHSKGDQPWVFLGRNDAEAEALVLWPPRAESWLIGKDSDAGRDWEQEEKWTTENEMAGWHHQLDGHEFEWTPGVGDGQGGLTCCHSWGRIESNRTERLNWTELKHNQWNYRTGPKRVLIFTKNQVWIYWTPSITSTWKHSDKCWIKWLNLQKQGNQWRASNTWLSLQKQKAQMMRRRGHSLSENLLQRPRTSDPSIDRQSKQIPWVFKERKRGQVEREGKGREEV